MRYVAEITFRTVPFEAEDEDAVRKRLLDNGLAQQLYPPSQLVEIVITELEDTD